VPSGIWSVSLADIEDVLGLATVLRLLMERKFSKCFWFSNCQYVLVGSERYFPSININNNVSVTRLLASVFHMIAWLLASVFLSNFLTDSVMLIELLKQFSKHWRCSFAIYYKIQYPKQIQQSRQLLIQLIAHHAFSESPQMGFVQTKHLIASMISLGSSGSDSGTFCVADICTAFAAAS
jgi:hypothetical protein